MKKYIITAFAFVTLLTGSVTFTACEDIDDVHELSLNRLLSPTNLIGKVNNKVNITASWDAMDGATAYTIEFYKENPNCEGTPIVSETIENTEFTQENLDGETEYTIRVKSIAEGLNDSKWTVITRSTEVTEQIFKTIEDTDVADKTVTVKWDVNAVINGSKTVKEIQLSWTDEEKKTQKTTIPISTDEAAAGQKVLSELLPSTAYEIKIKNDEGKTLGVKTFTTKADLTKVTQVHSGDDLIAVLNAAKEGDYIAIMDNAEYTIYAEGDEDKTYTLDKSLTISGYYSSNRPTIKGGITIAAAIKSLELSNVIFKGEDKAGGLLIMGTSPAEIETCKINGCDISNYKNSIISNETKVNIGTITIQNSIASNIGRDVIDIRGGKLKSIEVSACTFNNTARTFLRNNSDAIATVSFIQCTFYKTCHLDNKDNNGLFLMDKTTDNSELIVKQCLFSNIGIEKLGDNKYVGTWTRNDKMKASETYADNYYYDSPNLWTNSKYVKDHAKVATEKDPQFANAANGDFTVGNKDLAGNEIGDPRWIK